MTRRTERAAAAVLLAACGLFYGQVFGPDFIGRPMWLDEVFTAVVTGPDMADHTDLIARDVHPPLYWYLVAAFRRLPGMMDVGHAGRYFNLLMLLPMAAGGLRLAWVRGALAGLIAANLLVTSAYFGTYLIEFRSYFMVLSLSTLLTCLILIDPSPRSERWGRGVAIALSLVHFFGTAFACAALCARVITRWREGRPVRADVATLTVIVAFFGLWLLVAYPSYSNLLRNGFWIEVTWSTYRNTLDALLPVWVLTLVVAWLARGDGVTTPPVLELIFVGVAVLIGTFVLSLIEPIVTSRNLIVLLPLLAVGTAVLWAEIEPRGWLMAALFASAAIGAGFQLDTREADEDLDFIAAEAFTESCADAPLYSQEVFAPLYLIDTVYGRPDRPLTNDFAEIIAAVSSATWPADCTTPAFARRLSDGGEAIRADFAAAGFPVVARSSPHEPRRIAHPNSFVFTFDDGVARAP